MKRKYRLHTAFLFYYKLNTNKNKDKEKFEKQKKRFFRFLSFLLTTFAIFDSCLKNVKIN